MSRKNNRMSRKDNCNVYKIESLEKREMLSATAEDAAVDWINEQVITEVSTNLNLSENDIVKVGGTNLSINDLINGSFVLTSSDVQLTKQGNTDYYDVLLSDDINFVDVKVKGPGPYSIARSKPRFMMDVQSIGILISKNFNNRSTKR